MNYDHAEAMRKLKELIDRRPSQDSASLGTETTVRCPSGGWHTHVFRAPPWEDLAPRDME